MLDPKRVREDLDGVVAGLARRGFTLDSKNMAALEVRRKETQMRTEELQSQRNSKSKGIGQAKAKGEDIKPLLDEVAQLKGALEAAQEELNQVQTEMSELMMGVPNIPHDSTPDGRGEEENVEIRRWGEPLALDFEARDHVDLGVELKGMDFELGAKITGSRFVVMQGQIARMHRALTQFMLDTHTTEHGYTELYVPYVVNSDSLRGTGQLPKFKEDLFALGTAGIPEEEQVRDYYLIPTAEVPVTNI
ncbi:MAG TPA: serine--tRNA ligase, partial [Gammaproteobacteria bacterium]|nr:serine--tRNA ligase [Gammaproteobacteria bacterium]